MSSYSDFFGVASSGGGGLPIGSYQGILTFPTQFPSALNSPPGYNSTTGIYNSPDGTTWLRTGKTIDTSQATTDVNPTYPLAPVRKTVLTAATGRTTPSQFSQYAGVNPYIVGPSVTTAYFNTGTQLNTFNITNNATGTAFGTSVPGLYSYNYTNDTLLAYSTTTVSTYTTTGTATGFSFDTAPNAPTIAGISYAEQTDHYHVRHSNSFTSPISIFDGTGTYVANYALAQHNGPGSNTNGWVINPNATKGFARTSFNPGRRNDQIFYTIGEAPTYTVTAQYFSTPNFRSSTNDGYVSGLMDSNIFYRVHTDQFGNRRAQTFYAQTFADLAVGDPSTRTASGYYEFVRID